jgi:prolyl-tRNA editing enzyme YbaK/EbsC (Cys-tRNA(Pro) deacylase)
MVLHLPVCGFPRSALKNRTHLKAGYRSAEGKSRLRAPIRYEENHMNQSLHSPDELRDLAAAHAIVATLHSTGRPMPTVEAAAEALGLPVAVMTKNIVWLAGDTAVLVIAAGQARIDDRALAQQLGVSRRKVSMASPERAYAISGFVVGCMPSFGHRAPLPTLIDTAVAQLDRVYGGTGDPTVLISLSTSDLIRLTGGTIVSLTRGDF